MELCWMIADMRYEIQFLINAKISIAINSKVLDIKKYYTARTIEEVQQFVRRLYKQKKSADHMDRCHLVHIFSHLTRLYIFIKFF